MTQKNYLLFNSEFVLFEVTIYSPLKEIYID
jgi:hypothetical protein